MLQTLNGSGYCMDTWVSFNIQVPAAECSTLQIHQISLSVISNDIVFKLKKSSMQSPLVFRLLDIFYAFYSPQKKPIFEQTVPQQLEWVFGYPFGICSGLLGFRVFRIKDFSPIRVFLNSGSGSDDTFKWFLNFLKFIIIYFKFLKIYNQNNILDINLNNIYQNT